MKKSARNCIICGGGCVKLKRFQDTEHEFGPAFHKFFHLHYNNDTGHFVYGEPKLQVIRDELDSLR